MVSELIDARFPDYRAIIPKTKSTRTVVDTAALLKAVRVALLSAGAFAIPVAMRLRTLLWRIRAMFFRWRR